MEYPQNPTQPFRIETLAPALVAVMSLAIVQPLIVIAITIQPLRLGEAPWRVQVFALLLGAAPQISVGLAFVAAIGLFGERYRAVRAASLAAIAAGVCLIPVVIFDALDILEVRQMVPQEGIRGFDLNALQAATVGAILALLLIWFGRRGLLAGKQPPAADIVDALHINKEPAPGPLDPRVVN